MPPNSPDVLRYTPPRNLKLIALVALAIAAAVVVVGLISRVHPDQGVQADQGAVDAHGCRWSPAKADTRRQGRP